MKNIEPIRTRVRANALAITLIISVIIGIFCSLLITLGYANLALNSRVKNVERVRRDLRSGINMLLADTSLVVNTRADTLDLFSNGGDTAILKRESWGLFTVASVEARAAGLIKVKAFLIGRDPDPPLDASLYLADHRTGLSISGDAVLNGNAYLPKGMLEPVFVNQRGYSRTPLINGNIKNSADTLPPIDPRVIARLSQLRRSPGINGFTGSTDHSFTDSAFVIHCRLPIYLSSTRLRGHILIISDSAIHIAATAQLEDVIVDAPFVEIDPGFSGTIQALASDSLIVGANSRLSYPSSLVLIKAVKSSFQPRIIIRDNCRLEGTILTVSPDTTDLVATYAELGTHSLLSGVAYVSGFFFPKGQVHGTVLADHLLYRANYSNLVNYLVDATIDRNALSVFFKGPRLFAGNANNNIAKWVN